MKLSIRDALGILKVFMGAIAFFLIVFGIHWLAILAGVILGIMYFAIPKRYIN